jgi:hypothetical protein
LAKTTCFGTGIPDVSSISETFLASRFAVTSLPYFQRYRVLGNIATRSISLGRVILILRECIIRVILATNTTSLGAVEADGCVQTCWQTVGLLKSKVRATPLFFIDIELKLGLGRIETGRESLTGEDGKQQNGCFIEKHCRDL